jgi:LacI family transcriptional regulator
VRKAATIRDVAKAAEVSVSVVSRVLNGTGPVAAATRLRVVRAMDELGYRPRAAARELSQGGQSPTIGLLVPDLTNPFFGWLADRVVWEARTRGAQVVLMTTQEDPHLEAACLDALLNRSVGGVIATPTGGNVQQWTRLQQLRIDLVFVDRSISELDGVDLVSIQNVSSGHRATDYLLGLGHRRIALVSGPLSTSTGRSRIKGYRDALENASVDWDPQLVRDVSFRGHAGGDAVAALLAVENPPTALIVANTAQVLSSLRRLSQMGVQVPTDLSVIVFDDNPWAELVTPPLSTVRQPIEMLALHAVELVLGRMQGRLPAGVRTVEVEAEFIPRRSCAALGAANKPTSRIARKRA